MIEPPTGNEDDDKFDCENLRWNSSDLGKIPGLYFFSFANHNVLFVSQFVSRTVSYIIDSPTCFISIRANIVLGFICKVIHS